MSYLIITPVRDEEYTIELTINSVINQTILPLKWLIIDDNSIDGTSKIIDEYSSKYEFISKLAINKDTDRVPGKGPISTFNYGIECIDIEDYDYVVKLDADMNFNNNYFERIFNKFSNNSKLGIVSGLIVEKNTMKPSKSHYHQITQGNTKVYKRELLEKIYPIEEVKGWDFLDNIKAMYYGYETKIIKNLIAIHLKPLDSNVGYKKENYLKGYYDAFLKYPSLFVLIKGLKKIFIEKPIILNGYFYVYGYCKNLFIDKEFYKDKEVIDFLIKFQRRRLKELFFFKKNLYY